MTHNCLTTEEFIKRAKAFHGDTYDYSETKYTKCSEKVKIKCKSCGFEGQLLSNQYVCPNCGKEAADGALFWLAECEYRQKNYVKAAGLYNKLLKEISRFRASTNCKAGSS